jgi:hypothetical protein
MQKRQIWPDVQTPDTGNPAGFFAKNEMSSKIGM